MNDETIRILLVDDHAMLRRGMVLLLGEESDITVVGEVGDGKQAVEQVAIPGYISLSYRDVVNADYAGAIICLPQTHDINDLRQCSKYAE